MKSGHFFSIPECPADVDRLRRNSKAISKRTCPLWLTPQVANEYRLVLTVSCPHLTAGNQHVFREEVRELELAGFIVEKDRDQTETWYVYVRAESDYDLWSIGIYTGSLLTHLRPAKNSLNPVLTRDDISDVTAVLVADPFMVRTANCWFMFFELLNWHANKGEIGLARSDDGFQWHYQQRVLIEPFHLSYPYVFEENGSYYMIPEARQSGSVLLYEATKFPTEWKLVTPLIRHAGLVDASIFHRDGRWWMLVADVTQRGLPSLRLFVANELTGPWNEHPLSPVVRENPRTARPAGRVIEDGRQLFRFAQNCECDYGKQVSVFEIKELSITEYQEASYSEDPILCGTQEGWNADGMHHVDPHRLADGSWLACVDGWSRRINAP